MISTAGTYQLGFASYNWDDENLDPNLFVSAIQGTYTGTPVPIVGGGSQLTFATTGGDVAGSISRPRHRPVVGAAARRDARRFGAGRKPGRRPWQHLFRPTAIDGAWYGGPRTDVGCGGVNPASVRFLIWMSNLMPPDRPIAPH